MNSSDENTSQQGKPLPGADTAPDDPAPDAVKPEATQTADADALLATALDAARTLASLLPGVPLWMQRAFAVTAKALAQPSTTPVTAAQLALRLGQFGAKLVDEEQSIPAGFPPLSSAANDGHDPRRLKLVARVLQARLADAGATVPLYTLDDLLETANETAFAEDDIDSDALRRLHRLARSGALRRLAPLPATDALAALHAHMPNFRAPIDFCMGQSALARRQGAPGARLPPILLLGAPGLGKTTFAQRLAATIASPFAALPFASASASWILGGLDRAWHSARPGHVYTMLQQSAVANPVLLLDEIDKACGDQRYDPLGPLYGLLEPGTARRFSDECAMVPIDASHVIWIATANDADRIPAPLLSRFVTFDIPPPDKAAMRQIVRHRHAEVCGSAPCEALDDEVVDALITFSPREVGQRLREAVGRAALRAEASGSERLQLRVEDVGHRQRGKVRMGFRP